MYVGRVKSELRLYQREWFASAADDVLVGYFQCKPRRSVVLNKLFANLAGDQISENHCLNFAFKADREMNLNGDILGQEHIRTVSWQKRRDYDSHFNSDSSSLSGNMVAFSLSHSPTCRQYMHRYVESCGAIMCSGEKSTLQWREMRGSFNPVVCNNANDAIIVSTSVIGNYPSSPKNCIDKVSYIDKVECIHFNLLFNQFNIPSGSCRYASTTVLGCNR